MRAEPPSIVSGGRVCRAVLALLAALLPADFRRRHSAELEDTLVRGSMDVDGGRGAKLRYWTAAALDVVAAALRLRLWPPRPDFESAVAPRDRLSWGHYGRTLMGSLAVDLHHARRALVRTPGVVALIVVMLALGIGLNTAVFSVVHAVLLRPLPYAEPDALVQVSAAYTRDDVKRAAVAGGTYAAIAEGVTAFESTAAITSIRQNLTGTRGPLQVQVGWASRNFFDVLGVAPALGAGFTRDALPGTLVLSHALWRDAFGADEGVLGRSVRLDGRVYTIAGVLPPSFRLLLPSFPREVDVFKVPDDWWQNGDVWKADAPEFGILKVLARLRPEATLDQARHELEALAARYRETHTAWARAGLAFNALPLHESVVGKTRPSLVLLFGAVGLVLLVACANVASLLLVRSESRRREIALRMALGAGRARIVRMLFAESLWLAALGGGLGIGMGVVATRLLQRLEIAGLPRSGEIGVDASTLAFALLLSVSSTLIFGLAPAWRTARPDLHLEANAGRATLDPSRLRVHHLLVVGQLAVSLVLLSGAGLLGASLARLQGLEPGFEARNALTFSLTAPGSRYERPLGTDRLFRALEDRVRHIPGVESAGVVWPLPLSGRVWSNHYAAGAVRDAERAYAEYRMATPAYFDAARIRLVEGRLFRADDRPGVVVVNRKVAERAWPGEAAVGRTLRARPWGPPDEAFEVLGVVEDVRNADLREPPAETLYFDSRGWSWTDWEVSYVVRAATDPMALVPAIRRELEGLDPEIPLAEVRLLSDLVDGQLSSNRFALALLGVFAGSAGALALVGLYGLVSYTVSRRGREVGIRVALGASRRQIVSLVLGQAVGLAASGVALGLLAAVGLTRLLGSLLFGVSPLEPTVLVTAAAGLGLAALAAALAPARRAASVDPATALKAE